MIFQFDTADDVFYGDEESFDALMRGEKWIPCSLDLQDKDLVFQGIVRADRIVSVSPVSPGVSVEKELFDEKRFLELIFQHTNRVKEFKKNIQGES